MFPYKTRFQTDFEVDWGRTYPKSVPPVRQKKELELYPKFKAAYIRAFERMIQYRKDNGMECEWKTGEEVMRWWIGDVKKKEKEIDGQCSMF